MAAFHAAMSAREELSLELRAAHVCAAVAMAANGRRTHADGWHFVVDRSAVGAMEQEVASRLAVRFARDPRAAAACGSISGYSDTMLMCHVVIALAIVACMLVMTTVPRGTPARRVKSTRAEALAALAALPEPASFDQRARRSSRHKRPARACACGMESSTCTASRPRS